MMRNLAKFPNETACFRTMISEHSLRIITSNHNCFSCSLLYTTNTINCIHVFTSRAQRVSAILKYDMLIMGMLYVGMLNVGMLIMVMLIMAMLITVMLTMVILKIIIRQLKLAHRSKDRLLRVSKPKRTKSKQICLDFVKLDSA